MTFVPEWLTNAPVCGCVPDPVAVDRQPPAPLLLPHGEQQVRTGPRGQQANGTAYGYVVVLTQVVVPLYLLVRSSRALLRMARAAPKKEA